MERRGVLSAAGMAAVLVLSATVALAQGPVLIVGIDTEFGFRPVNPSHGTIATWANVIQQGILNKTTNGNTDILVIGGNKGFNDEITNFWTQIGAALGRNVQWANGNQIASADFTQFAMVAVANSTDGTGRLTQQESTALNARQADVTQFVCTGGGIFASSSNFTNAYAYLTGTAPVNGASLAYMNINATAAGTAMGITNTNLDGGPWHTVFTAFPGFLQVLAQVNPTNQTAAIGGEVAKLEPKYTLRKNRFCLGETIVADATPTTGEVNHFWSIQESDANWNRYGPEIMDWFTGPAGTRDLSAWAASKNFKFKCNTFYRVKLAVSGLCEGWKETTQLIFVSCAQVNAGQDRCCCSSPIQLGSTSPAPPQQYQWSPGLGLNSTTVKNPTLSNSTVLGDQVTYHVTATNGDGCTASDDVTIYCRRPQVNITKQQECCKATLTASGKNYTLLQWSTGATGSSIDITEPGTYTVKASNPCGSTTASVTIPAGTFPKGDFPTLIHPTAFTPNGDGNNDIFKIFHLGLAEGQAPAYNATKYELRIFDRWGGDFKVASGESCSGFPNGAIQWDGRINGNLVQQDVYTWKLKLENCNRSTWTQKHRKTRYVCTRTRWVLWCFCTRCVEGYWQEYDETKDNDAVTVVR